MSLPDLIKRLEAAKEGGRELDAEIAVAIFETQKTDDDLIYARECARSDNCALGTYWHVQRSGMSLRTSPAYTTSLDAALTLVPDGYDVQISRVASIYDVYVSFGDVGPRYQEYKCEGKLSFALALCIAAMKAREARR